MPQARFQSTLADFSIDEESGVIRGVRVMESGKVACFKNSNGESKSIILDSRHIQALLRQAGNRAIPVHWTHSHADGKADGLETKVGKLAKFTVGEDGHLRADLHLAPGAFRETAIWHAKEDPEHMMISAVFGYAQDDQDCIPLSFEAADLVECGAGVTALLAEDSKPMDETTIESTPATIDLSSLQATLSIPGGLEAVKAFIKAFEKAAEPEVEEVVTETPNDDAGAVAAMAAKEKEITDRVTAALAASRAELLIEAEAKMVAMLGATKVPAAKTTEPEKALFGLEKVRAQIKAQLSKSTN